MWFVVFSVWLGASADRARLAKRWGRYAPARCRNSTAISYRCKRKRGVISYGIWCRRVADC
ncbi:hypothetical protein GCM10027423_25490 [Spirosoma arcticum]